MDIRIATHAGEADITLSGSFTFEDAIPFKEIIALTDNKSIHSLVLHMHGVDFIDSAALGMLMLLRRHADNLKQHITLARATGQVEKIFRLSRMDALFTVVA